ncbi:MAG: hypothetical protein COZ59_00515 [Bacteroidetes bacterium CG_4_8_14_3_um_filter_31_14]|nr:MAG: hypothetical protein COZ59_00515 [Bacteroidetes bacterium CG_4_8_14_3_um_filter_31_14]
MNNISKFLPNNPISNDEMEDYLELIVLLEREYGIKIQDPKEGRKVLVDINTMLDYIQEYRTK